MHTQRSITKGVEFFNTRDDCFFLPCEGPPRDTGDCCLSFGLQPSRRTVSTPCDPVSRLSPGVRGHLGSDRGSHEGNQRREVPSEDLVWKERLRARMNVGCSSMVSTVTCADCQMVRGSSRDQSHPRCRDLTRSVLDRRCVLMSIPPSPPSCPRVHRIRHEHASALRDITASVLTASKRSLGNENEGPSKDTDWRQRRRG